MNAIKQMKKKRNSKKKPEILTEEEERQEHELRMKIQQSLNTQQVLRNEVEETEQIQLGQQRTDGISATAGQPYQQDGNGMMGHPETRNTSGVAGNSSQLQLQHQHCSQLPQHQNPSSILEQMQEMQMHLEFQRRNLEEQIQIKRQLQQHQHMAHMGRGNDTTQHAYFAQSQSHDTHRFQPERQDQVFQGRNPYGSYQDNDGNMNGSNQQHGRSMPQMHRYPQTAQDQIVLHHNTAVTGQYLSYQTPLEDESSQSRQSIADLDPSDSWLRSENGTNRSGMGFHDVGNMSASFSSVVDDDGEPFRINSDRPIDTPVASNESKSTKAALPRCSQTAAAAAQLNPIKENEESPEDEASNLSCLGQSSVTKGSLTLSLLDDNDFLNVVENLVSTDSATNDALQAMDSMNMSLDSQTMKNLMKSNISMSDATQNSGSDERSSPSDAGRKRLAGSSEGSTGDLSSGQRSNRGSSHGREGVGSGGGRSSIMSEISQWCGSDNPFDAASSDPSPADEVSASNGAGKCQGSELRADARAQQANQSVSSQGSSSQHDSGITSISLSLMSAITDDLAHSVQTLDVSNKSND